MANMKYKTNPIKEDYKIGTKVLGVGINGKVVECESLKTGQKFALKILRDVPKAKREAELHFLACSHPNIVKIYEVYENTYNGIACLFLIMECMTGGELFTRIQERAVAAFTEREAANIMYQISSAISYLHKLNIAHRDIKPENLLYSAPGEEGVLKLTDFGFAKRAADDNDQKVLATPLYTPYYSSPEVFGTQKYDKTCDVWSLGVIMYILLCGYPPFFSTHGLPISPGMKSRIRAGQYNFSGPEWDRVSEAAKDLIRRCLITDPGERATIENVMAHKWIVHYNKNPITPLATSQQLTVTESAETAHHFTPKQGTAQNSSRTRKYNQITETTPNRLKSHNQPVLREEQDNWTDLSDEMEAALASMRVDDVHIKRMGEAKNSLLEKRRKNPPGNQSKATNSK